MDQAAAKTPDAEKPLNLSNGVLKRNHQAAFNNNQAVAGAGTVVVYKECLKNHAASLGAHAVDGCGEFMASPTANPADPTSLKCAACGCHRNFHRRDPEDVSFPSSNITPALEYQPHHRHHPPPPPPPLPHGDAGAHSSPSSPSPPPISSSYYPSNPHLMLTLSGGMSSAATKTPQTPAFSHPNGRKRFRTRFTQHQKEKMTELAEKLGWKMQKRDEDLISGFCNEIGVEKGVFKVWMHNNKSNFSRRDQPVSIPSTGGTATAVNNCNGVEVGQNYQNENDGNNNNDHFQVQNVNRHTDSFSGRVGGPNGSSSSS